jgi:hypothetical protein
MTNKLVAVEYEIEIEVGEPIALPPEIANRVGSGRWLVTFRPLDPLSVRGHGAFLNSYAPEDEGLYDDDLSG